MNACARAAGADKTTASAATAATNFEVMIIAPPRNGREIGRSEVRGQPMPSANRVAPNSRSGPRAGCRPRARRLRARLRSADAAHWNVMSRHLEISEPRPEEMVMQPRTFCAVLSLAHIE